MNPEVRTVKNILNEQSTDVSGYEPQSSVDTYYGRYDETLTTALTEKINVRATGDDLKTTVVDFLVDEEKTLIWAYQEDAIIVPKSLGGSMDGVNIPFEIHYNGNRKRVNLDLTTYAVSEYSAG
nr:MAG TPA: hypothetical protein [Caudoviricetes sp.]